MNIYCTKYDIVQKAAKKYAGFRLKEKPEDHEGGMLKGQTNQKLSEEWDISFHDLPITPDYLNKMLPYQKVS